MKQKAGRVSPGRGLPPKPIPVLVNPRGPTARDVARLAGVSQSTVSRVLNNTGTNLIGKSTYQRVLDVAAELGYSPHPLARALRGKHTQLIGLIVREIDDPFFAKFISILSIQARELGYQIVLGHAQSDPSQAMQMTAVLETRHCDGVLLLGDVRGDSLATEAILKTNHAVVALCRGQSRSPIPTVNSDNVAGTKLILEHLYALGHRRLAFISGGWLGDMRERQDAYQAFVESHELLGSAEYVQDDVNSLDGGYRALERLLQLPTPPTAVLAADDVMAIGALKAAADHGLQVPSDLSVTGFDDIEMARFTHPALTTVRQPVELMSRRAMQWLVALIGSAEAPEPDWVTPILPELIVRASTGRAPSLD